MKKIAFAGTDGRTLLCALVVSTATSDMATASIHNQVVTRHLYTHHTPRCPLLCVQKYTQRRSIALHSLANEGYYVTAGQKCQRVTLKVEKYLLCIP